MDHGEGHRGPGFKLAGAIFMSNRATKQECFRRKIFGLPASQADFVKKVKAGMFLYLFEHENRKLYGVFEAVTNGAMNIVADAFRQSGMSFPAQVQFKILWKCHPLSEDEFSSAIEENYFMPNKFNFGLSYSQVVKLCHLFSAKMVSPQISPRFEVHNKFDVKAKDYGLGNSRRAGKSGSVRCDTVEHYTESDTLPSRNSGLSGLKMNHSMYHENADLILEDHAIDAHHRLFPTDFNSRNPHVPTSTRSTFQNNHTLTRSSLVSPAQLPYYRKVPSFEDVLPSDALGMNEPSRFQTLTDAQPLHPRHPYPLQRDQETFSLASTCYGRPSLPSTDYWNISLPSTDYRSHSLPTSGYLSLDASDCCKDLSTTISEPVQNNVDYHDHSRMSFSQCHDSSPSKIYTAEYTDSLNLSSAYGRPYASQQEDSAKQPRFWSGPCNPLYSESYEDNMTRNLEPKSLANSFEFYGGKKYERAAPSHFSEGRDYFPTSSSSMFHSDAAQGRPSVFSRLSKAPQAWKETTNPSLDELLKLLSSRNKQWNEMPRKEKQSVTVNNYVDGNNDGKQLECTTVITSKGADSIESEAMVEERMEFPFLNFKRRSDASKVEAETEGVSVKSSKGKNKRRKLVRPSLTEEDHFIQLDRECQSAQSSEGSDYKRSLSLEVMNPKPNLTGLKAKAVKPLMQPSAGMDDESQLTREDDGSLVPMSHGNPETDFVQHCIDHSTSDKTFCMAGNGSFVLPIPGTCEGNKLDEVSEKNATAPCGNKNNIDLEGKVAKGHEIVPANEDIIKDIAVSDSITGSVSIESDVGHGSLITEEQVAEMDEGSHMDGVQRFALPGQGNSEGDNSCIPQKNETVYDKIQNILSLEANVGNADLMDPKDNVEGSRHCIREGIITVADKVLSNSEDYGKLLTVSVGNSQIFSAESDTGHAQASDGKLDDSDSKKMFHVVDAKSVVLPVLGETEARIV